MKYIQLDLPRSYYCTDFMCYQDYAVANLDVHNPLKIDSVSRFVVANYDRQEMRKHNSYFMEFMIYDPENSYGVSNSIDWGRELWTKGNFILLQYYWGDGRFVGLSIYDGAKNKLIKEGVPVKIITNTEKDFDERKDTLFNSLFFKISKDSFHFALSISQYKDSLYGYYSTIVPSYYYDDYNDYGKLNITGRAYGDSAHLIFTSFKDSGVGEASLINKDSVFVWHVLKKPVGKRLYAPVDEVMTRYYPHLTYEDDRPK